MYRPAFTVVHDEDEARAMVTAARSGWFVTSTAEDGPVATLLPVLWQGQTVIAHLAKANPQWRAIQDGDRALVIVSGPEAYVSPSWYPSKDEHGRVVPTWNYLVGIELLVDRIEGKAKTSQNRPEPDRLGVIDGLASDAHQDGTEMVRIMRSTIPPPS